MPAAIFVFFGFIGKQRIASNEEKVVAGVTCKHDPVVNTVQNVT